jgi:hypothetical protein
MANVCNDYMGARRDLHPLKCDLVLNFFVVFLKLNLNISFMIF